jgi:hypothetical protein
MMAGMVEVGAPMTIRSTSLESLDGLIQKLGRYAVFLSLLCYGVGFVITNLYLASMGVTSVELLRARYILAGMLFLAFCLPIGLLVVGLARTLRPHSSDPQPNVLGIALYYSAKYLDLLYCFAVPAIAVLSGDGLWAAGSIPSDAVSLPWSQWLRLAPTRIFWDFVPALFGAAGIVVLFAVLLIVNPRGKDGQRTPRREILLGIAKDLAGMRISSVLGFATVLTAFIVVFFAGDLLEFIKYGETAVTAYANGPALSGGWLRFFLAISGVYLLIAALVSASASIREPSKAERKQGESALPLIVLISLCVLVIVPVYAVAVYPYLPQQVGGGRLVNVRVSTTSELIKPIDGDGQASMFLVDRSSSSLILLVAKDKPRTRDVVEVPMSLVGSVTYLSNR